MLFKANGPKHFFFPHPHTGENSEGAVMTQTSPGVIGTVSLLLLIVEI